MMVSIIVATDENGVIGRTDQAEHNGLLWHLPAEQARFKQITMGHPIIMGRKTHEAIGRVLPGRLNVVVTSDPKYHAEGCKVVHSFDKALKAAGDKNEIFIIGGSTIFEQALPITEKIYLTAVHGEFDGDIYFKFDKANWRQIDKESYQKDDKNKYDFDFLQLVRK